MLKGISLVYLLEKPMADTHCSRCVVRGAELYGLTSGCLAKRGKAADRI